MGGLALKHCVYNTDPDWLNFLRDKGYKDNINFWRKDKRKLKLEKGDYFYFKLRGHKHIAGRARFVEQVSLPLEEAWNSFGERNGLPSLEMFRGKVNELFQDYHTQNSSLNCLILDDAEWLPESDYFYASSEFFPPNVLGPKYYDDNEIKDVSKHFSSDQQTENQLDRELIEALGKMPLPVIDKDAVEYNPAPKEKPKPTTSSGGRVYPRDKQTSINAISRANHKCELDEKHPSFIRRTTSLKYTEPHHLIPMSHQDSFGNSLDVEANIVALCSNCHNQIHYGLDAKDLAEALYEKRKEELEQAGIPIKLDALLKMY